MAIQQTEKEYKESQNRKRETQKRQVEQKRVDEQNKRQKKQDEDRNEKKVKELKGYLTKVKNQKDRCAANLEQHGYMVHQSSRLLTPEYRQKYCSCNIKKHDDLVKIYLPQQQDPPLYQCSGPFNDLEYACYEWYHEECIIGWDEKLTKERLQEINWICPSCEKYKNDEEWFRENYKKILVELKKTIEITN